MKKFFEDFKAFAMKGNVVDMAVGVVVGGAFGKIVTSFVNDIITPLLGILLGKMSFTDLKWVITPAVLDETGNVVTAELALTYGNFIQQVIDFLIISLSIFVVLRLMMTLKTALEKKEEAPAEEPTPAAPPAPSEELVTLREIRDLLKK